VLLLVALVVVTMVVRTMDGGGGGVGVGVGGRAKMVLAGATGAYVAADDDHGDHHGALEILANCHLLDMLEQWFYVRTPVNCRKSRQYR
jgi:hypothetical protein